MYLNLKGFIMSPDGRPVLVKEARAAANPKEADGLAQKIAANVNVILPKGHPVGSKDAPISIYEYSSFGCYHCSDFHLETLPKLQKDFIDSGKVKLVFVDFPLDSKSMMAAMIADCMPEKNYHEFIKLLFKNNAIGDFRSAPKTVGRIRVAERSEQGRSRQMPQKRKAGSEHN